MPHAEQDTMTINGEMNNSTPMLNGEEPHSKVLSHLQTYPVVHDSLEFYKSHPYGAKSLSLFHTTYRRLIAPLHPYLQTPYSYLSPYLTRADELGDSGLSRVESTFPIVKEDTSKLKETLQQVAFLPLSLAGQGKDYLSTTWQDEYSKTQGKAGVLKNVKVLVSTELKIGHDGFLMVREYMGKGKEVAGKKMDGLKK